MVRTGWLSLDSTRANHHLYTDRRNTIDYDKQDCEMILIHMDQWESQPSPTRRTRRHNSWVRWKLADCEQPRAISIAYVGKLKLYAAHPHILSSLSPEAFQILSHYESYHRVCRETRAHYHHFCSPNVMHILKQVRRRQGKCKVEASVRYAIRESLGRGTSLIIV